MFSRAVRWPVVRRRATASGPLRVERSRPGARAPRRGRGGSVEVELRGASRVLADAVVRLDEDQRRPLEDRVARRRRRPAARPRRLGGDDVLHLHRLDHEQLLPRGAPGRLRPLERDHRALQRRRQRQRALGAVDARGRRRVRRRLAGGAGSSSAKTASGSSCRELRGRAAPGDRRRGPEEALAGGRGIRREQRWRGALRRSACGPGWRRIGVGAAALQERDVGRHALDAELATARGAPGRTASAVVGRGAVHDQLGEQRVEARVGRVAGVAEGVDAHAGPGGRLEGGERAAGRARAAVGVDRLHVDAQLHRVAARRGQRAGEAELGERARRRRAQLRLHQVDADHLLGDRVLDLQPRVGLDEPKSASLPGAAATRNSKVPRPS